LLKIDSAKIIQAIEEEITAVQAELDKIKALKAKELSDHITDVFNKTMTQLNSHCKQLHENRERKLKIEQAVKTLRKLPEFGGYGTERKFEWPDASTLISMHTIDKPIKVTQFRYRMRTSYGLHGILVSLSNGRYSSYFGASNTEATTSYQ
jgi:hypothetical protein